MFGKLCELPCHVSMPWCALLSLADSAAVVRTLARWSSRERRHTSLRIEREILVMVQNHTCVRQMIDIIESHSSLVLEYLDDNLLDVCSRNRLQGSDLKVVAHTVLEALAMLHGNGFVHTGQSIMFSSHGPTALF